LESTQASSPQKVESGLTGPARRKQSQSRDESEIQRREERPAAFQKKKKEGHKTKLSRKETALMQKSRAVSFRLGGLSIFGCQSDQERVGAAGDGLPEEHRHIRVQGLQTQERGERDAHYVCHAEESLKILPISI